MKKKRLPGLSVSRETIRRLDDPVLRFAAGADTAGGPRCQNITATIQTAEPTCGATDSVK
jgi:hypothetical protein